MQLACRRPGPPDVGPIFFVDERANNLPETNLRKLQVGPLENGWLEDEISLKGGPICRGEMTPPKLVALRGSKP